MDQATATFGHRMRSFAHRLGLPAFWRWWMGELAPLVPAAPRAAVQRRRLRPVLAFATDAAVLWMPKLHDGVLGFGASARVPLKGDSAAALQAGRAAIDALPEVAYGGAVGAANVVVALPPGQVLRKQMVLPAAVERHLRQTLAYDLDRHTPFKPDELYFDAVVVARDAQKNEIRVDWAAALRTAVDQARRQAENWGATVVAVTPDAPDSAGPSAMTVSRLNLLPEEQRPEMRWWRRWHLWVPLALVGAVALVAIVLPIWQKRGYVIALTQIGNQVRVQADASSALRQQLETMTGDYNFALGKKYAFTSTLQLLDDVTKLLPDDTWLTQLELKSSLRGKEPHREILLRGESGNAGRLVSLLEESKLFVEAAPRSPTTKIQPGPGEIFDLGAQLKPMPSPPPLLLASMAPAAAVLPAAAPPVAPAVDGAARPLAAPADATSAPANGSPVPPIAAPAARKSNVPPTAPPAAIAPVAGSPAARSAAAPPPAFGPPPQPVAPVALPDDAEPPLPPGASPQRRTE